MPLKEQEEKQVEGIEGKQKYTAQFFQNLSRYSVEQAWATDDVLFNSLSRLFCINLSHAMSSHTFSVHTTSFNKALSNFTICCLSVF